jgi:23S rRNA (cytosine1962-C5)-methyltransferase
MGHGGRDTHDRVRPSVFSPVTIQDYELCDSGAGEKLERYGALTVRRPDPQALWSARAPRAEWERADLRFERDESSGGKRGRWVGRLAQDAREAGWPVHAGDVVAIVRPTPFKHLGLFPEQAPNWKWLRELAPRFDVERPRLLNLFGYTGVASIAAARAGFAVTHVDASKTSLAWMRENARASGLADDGLRIVLDDALAFARREARRASTYACIVLDPPHFGRGPKGETWQFEDHMAPMIDACRTLLAPRAALMLSAYAIGFSPLSFVNLLGELGPGEIDAGELVLPERARPGLEPRTLPCGFCARWWRGVEAPGA